MDVGPVLRSYGSLEMSLIRQWMQAIFALVFLGFAIVILWTILPGGLKDAIESSYPTTVASTELTPNVAEEFTVIETYACIEGTDFPTGGDPWIPTLRCAAATFIDGHTEIRRPVTPTETAQPPTKVTDAPSRADGPLAEVGQGGGGGSGKAAVLAVLGVLFLLCAAVFYFKRSENSRTVRYQSPTGYPDVDPTLFVRKTRALSRAKDSDDLSQDDIL
jgi:hypothetical protein